MVMTAASMMWTYRLAILTLILLAEASREGDEMCGAIRAGDLQAVEDMLARGVHVDAVDHIQRTGLHCASRHGQFKIAEFLLKHNASTSATDKDGATPLQLAEWKNYVDIITLLKDHKYNTSLINGCKIMSEVYVDGFMWTRGCHHYSCASGSVTTTVQETCCEVLGEVYTNGQNWKQGCHNYTCNFGMPESNVVLDTCCEVFGEVFPDGHTQIINCHNYTCNSGSLDIVSIVDTCCEVYSNNHTWTQGCHNYTCKYGLSEAVGVLHTCCEVLGEVYPDGHTWTQSCHIYTCKKGFLETLGVLDSCCEVLGETYHDGHAWIKDCQNYSCNSGIFKNVTLTNCHDTDRRGHTIIWVMCTITVILVVALAIIVQNAWKTASIIDSIRLKDLREDPLLK
ncbi:uncharacterized protein [Cherax quadricarinatus]